jgi:hypothetical protein
MNCLLTSLLCSADPFSGAPACRPTPLAAWVQVRHAAGAALIGSALSSIAARNKEQHLQEGDSTF